MVRGVLVGLPRAVLAAASAAAVWVAAFVYTTGTSVLMSESTLLLEPLLNACCVGAALVVTGPLGRQKAAQRGSPLGAAGRRARDQGVGGDYILVLAGRAARAS